jgi:four helix bundle protein
LRIANLNGQIRAGKANEAVCNQDHQICRDISLRQICDVVRFQLVKAGTSVGANYREANRAESRNDFIHKIAIVEKEASESQYWLEM